MLWALALACHVAKQEMEKPLPMVMTFSVDDFTGPKPNNPLDNVLDRFRGSGITITDVKVRMPGES
jgi:hypothetical protein